MVGQFTECELQPLNVEILIFELQSWIYND
jgi:hypothetical protein